jgi:hypothetical protein
MPRDDLKENIAGVVNWLERGDGAADAFRTSLAAGGVVVQDVLHVCAAIDGLFRAGLTERALALLIIDKGPKISGGSSNGNPKLKVETVIEVSDAMKLMVEHLVPEQREKVAKVHAADIGTLDAADIAAVLASRKARKK